MYKLLFRWLALVLFAACSAFAPAYADKPATTTTTTTTTTGPNVLVLYDAPVGTEYDKLGMAYAIMLRNLLGHFDANVTLAPVQKYSTGAVNAYDATFYLGGIYDHALPATFLSDAATTTKTLVWMKYNIWQLAWNTTYNFTANRGVAFHGLRGLNAWPSSTNPQPGFFDTVQYKNRNFVKYFTYDSTTGAVASDPDLGVTSITDPAKAAVVVPVANPKSGEVAPYILRSGNFWYVADMPFSFIGPRDRYLVFSDILHDMLGIQHAENHRAIVRLEDVGALVSPDAMNTLSNYLSSKKIRFGIAVIPHYKDPLGIYNGGVPMDVPLSKAVDLKAALNYAVTKGGEIVMHGYTHQYGNMRNPHTGISGDDYEFWDIVANKPVPEDSSAWAKGRLAAGLKQLKDAGYTPIAWETPHYHASPLSSKVVPSLFSNTWQRVVYFTADKPNLFAGVGKDFAVGQIFPYVVNKDYYGQRVWPENLGNIEYDIREIDPTSFYNYTWQDIVTNADYALAVRDGFASFFFHPFWLEPELGTPGFEDFKKAIEGITNLGYKWVAPSSLK